MKTIVKFMPLAIASSLLLSCSLPGWVPFFGEEEKEEQKAQYNYCVYVSMEKCLSGPFSECGGGGTLANDCPFNTSNNYTPPSNNGNDKTQYNFCVYLSNEMCLPGPFSKCDGSGVLSNGCPFGSSNVEPSSPSPYVPPTQPVSSAANNPPPVQYSSAAQPPPSSNSVAYSSASVNTTKYYCDCGPKCSVSAERRSETGGGCFEMASQYGDCDLEWCKVATSCGRTDLKFCDYGEWNQYTDQSTGTLKWGGGCFRITDGNCDTQWGTVRSNCPWLN